MADTVDDFDLDRLSRLALEHLPDAVYLVHRDARIVYVNKAATDILGYSQDEFLAMRITQLNDNMSKDRWDVVWSFLTRTGGNSMEVLHRAKDGRLVPVEINARLVTFEGVDYSYAHVRDISTRRNLEVRLRQTEKMEALGQLAGGVAHDFNNQLVGVLGYAELLKDELQDHPMLLDYVEQIMGAGARSADLTRQLLAFSRQAPPSMTRVNVHELLHEALNVLRRTLVRKISIQCNLDAQRVLVQGDASLLSNSFLNLAINARDAMAKDGGELVIETKEMELDHEFCENHGLRVEPGSYIRVSFTDTGVGIPEDITSRVFEPFFTTKPKGEGTGLGLAAVYGTVVAHEGAVTVYSELDKGTAFHVYLPLSKALGAEHSSKELRPHLSGEPHILVIEDEDPVRRIAILTLQSLGCRVTAFSSPAEAIEYFGSFSADVDAVLLDMCMPVMDGSTTFRLLKQIDPEVRVLLASGYTVRGQAKRLLDEGAKGFLQKPFLRADLADKLRTVLH